MSSALRHDPSHSGAEQVPGDATPGLSGFLSIVIPAKNEAASLPDLLAETAAAFRPLTMRPANAGNPLRGFEVVVVDDGSTDDSTEVLRRLMVEYPELRPLKLAANAGQSAATHAGFWAARGQWVAILDADLQNPPSELARLWDALPGYDAALGWRMKREDIWWKRHISRMANRVRNWLLGQSIRDTGCAVRIFPRSAARKFPMFHGAHRFYGPLLLREGCSIVQVPVQHRARPHGQSHYTFWNRSLKVVVDLLGVAWLMRRPVRYQAAPMRVGEGQQAPAPHLGGAPRVVSAANRPAQGE